MYVVRVSECVCVWTKLRSSSFVSRLCVCLCMYVCVCVCGGKYIHDTFRMYAYTSTYRYIHVIMYSSSQYCSPMLQMFCAHSYSPFRHNCCCHIHILLSVTTGALAHTDLACIQDRVCNFSRAGVYIVNASLPHTI